MGSSFDDALRSGRARRGFRTRVLVVVGLVLMLTPGSAVAAAQPAGTDRATAGTVALEGVYRAVVATPSAEHDDAQPGTEHWLELADGEHIPLHLPLSAALVPGQHVRVHGATAARGAALQVESVESLAPAPSISATAGGTVSLLVMLVHWTEPDDQTPEIVRQQIAEDAAWYREVSYGALDLQGTVTPWLELDPSSSCRDGYRLVEQARAAAAAAGYDPSEHSHEMVYFPYSPECADWIGIAEVNGRISWINGQMTLKATVHELGHNLGLWHANAVKCKDEAGAAVPLGTNCHEFDGADGYDMMGQSGIGHFSAVHKDRLGWLGDRLLAVSATRSFTLSPLEHAGTVNAARLRAGDGGEYWLEFRRPIGFDTGSFADGALIRTERNNFERGPELLDLHPETFSFRDAALAPGERWTTPEGLTISIGQMTVEGLDVHVTFPGTATAPGAPTGLSISKNDADRSATISWGPPTSDGGAPITGYRVARSAYGSQAAWSKTVAATAQSQTFLNLVAGGTYTLTVEAINAVGTGPAASGTVTIAPARVPGAPVIGTASAGVAGGAVTATARWTPPRTNGGSPITGYRVRALRMSSTNTVLRTTTSAVQPAWKRSLTMTLPSRGNYRFTVQAISEAGAGSQSARSNLVAGR